MVTQNVQKSKDSSRLTKDARAAHYDTPELSITTDVAGDGEHRAAPADHFLG